MTIAMTMIRNRTVTVAFIITITIATTIITTTIILLFYDYCYYF